MMGAQVEAEGRLDGLVAKFAVQARQDVLLEQIGTLLSIVGDDDQAKVCDLLCGWLEHVGAGSPDRDVWGNLREDAAFWADIATPAELEAYVAHGLRAIERRNFAMGARKRLFAHLWSTMPEADRRAFVRRVDPDGKFHRGSA